MAFMRGDTEASMVSRGWSTSAFFEGVAHLCEQNDSIPELPDNLADLQEHIG